MNKWKSEKRYQINYIWLLWFSGLPDDAFTFSPSATTISQPVRSAHISNWSLAAARNVSPAAINIWHKSSPKFANI